jgi:hypothetical protein
MIVSDLPARRPSLAEFVEAHPAMRLVVTSGMTQTWIALMNSRAKGSISVGIWCSSGEVLRLHTYPRKAPNRRPIKTRRGDLMVYSYSRGAIGYVADDRAARNAMIQERDSRFRRTKFGG